MRKLVGMLSMLALGACAPTQALKESDRAAIATIAVSPEVKVPPEPYYFGPGSPLVLFGAVGGAILAAMNVAPTEALTKLANDNGILIGEIVRDQMVDELRAAKRLGITSDGADAVLRLEVTLYGVSVPHGFSGEFVPTLRVRGELLAKEGRVVWQGDEYVHPMSNVVAPVSSDAIRDPQILRSMWTTAAKRAAHGMMKTL